MLLGSNRSLFSYFSAFFRFPPFPARKLTPWFGLHACPPGGDALPQQDHDHRRGHPPHAVPRGGRQDEGGPEHTADDDEDDAALRPGAGHGDRLPPLGRQGPAGPRRGFLLSRVHAPMHRQAHGATVFSILCCRGI